MALRPPSLFSLSQLEVRVLVLAQDLAQGTDSVETDSVVMDSAATVRAMALEATVLQLLSLFSLVLPGAQDLAQETDSAATEPVVQVSEAQALEDQDLAAAVTAVEDTTMAQADLVTLARATVLAVASEVLATGSVGLVSAELALVIAVSVEMALAAQEVAPEDPALVAPAVREQVAMALGTEPASSRLSLSSRSTVVGLALGKLMLMQQARTLRRRTRQ